MKDKRLTFAKHCRFPDVDLTAAGIETKGIIWKLKKKLINSRRQIRGRTLPGRLCQKIRADTSRLRKVSRKSLHFNEYESLWLLCRSLNKYRELRSRLKLFLQEVAPKGYREDWTSRHLMHLMAKNLAQAVRDGKQLQLGCIWRREDYSPYTAIFVPSATAEVIKEEQFVFTAWNCRECLEVCGVAAQRRAGPEKEASASARPWNPTNVRATL